MKTVVTHPVSVFLNIISGWARRPGSPSSAGRRPGLLAVAAVFCLLPARSFGLALLNDTVSLTPADQEMSNLANNVVRVYESFGPAGETPKPGFGTGTIISIVPDGQGGDYYNVLTADHVVNGAVSAVNDGNVGRIGIGFGSNPGNTVGNFFPLTVNNLAKHVRLDGGNSVDLAVFSVDVSARLLAAAAPGPANILAPGFGVYGLQLEVPIADPSDAPGNTIVQAGYGALATAKLGDPAKPGQARYAPIASSYGTFNSGGNTIPANGLVGARDLESPGFDAIIGTFAFTRDAKGNPVSGTTDIMSGDSGGPTFQANNGIYDLIGVHQGSQTELNVKDETTWATPGQTWTDVDVSAYTSWINQAITQVDVPEPSTWALAFAGGLLCLFRFRLGESARKKALKVLR
jgi:hypothetical protein